MKVFIVLLTLFFTVSSFAGNGTFSLVKGTVFLKEKGAREKRARRGLKLNVGDVVRSTSGGYAKITMSDKNIIHVGPETEFVLEKYVTEADDNGPKAASLNVLYGKVRTALEQKYDGSESRFNVRTEAAVLGVRGTDFITEHNQTAVLTRATTLSGTVNVAELVGSDLGDSYNLGAGMSIVVLGGEGLSDPIQLPNDFLNEVVNSVSSASSSAKPKVEKMMKDSVATDVKEPFAVENLRPVRAEPGMREKLLEREIITSSGNSSGDATVNLDVN